uniref:ATP-dependent DNA helicase n=1 Tax=Daphnia galeata TaxID=27404 RepID=A0A8J2WKD1_9CRUS|nr:unnamed protein product [Daphnia galeata]
MTLSICFLSCLSLFFHLSCSVFSVTHSSHQKSSEVIGRLYTVPKALNIYKQSTGVEYPTFKLAAIALNLLEDDRVWESTMTEAATYQMPHELRQLFVDICLYCNPANPLHLLESNMNHLMEDFIRRGHAENVSRNLALKWIQDKLRLNNQTIEDLSLPVLDFHLIHQLIQEQLNETDENTRQEQRLMGEMMATQFNEGQRSVFDQIMASINNVDNTVPRLYFLDGPGGTGKSFLNNSIITVLQGQGKNVIAVASTGIASTLLIGGATYHSAFKLYPPITETTRSRIEAGSYAAELIRRADIIISDEATMKLNLALDAINELLQTTMKNNLPYGGKVLLLGGDFRQCLPVVKHGNRVQVTEACIINNRTWPLFKQIRLVQNMRTVPGSQEFANWLINLGNGTRPQTPKLNDPDLIEIPPDFLHMDTNMIEHVFGHPTQLLDEGVSEQISNRAILCPKNEDCRVINNNIVSKMPGPLKVYKSIDTMDSEDPEEIANYLAEILNTFDVSGLPPHQLNLKVGAIVILLKNIDSRHGLCNGTRLLIKNLTENVIVATIATRKHKDRTVFVPRMSMSPTDSDLPFKLKRLQFPVILAFAMTINKSQGQTFDRVCIYLPEPVFSHGQLYVAFSRATSREGVKVQIKETDKQGHLLKNLPGATEDEKKKVFTKNIVYKEVLLTTL